jgi:hypothetical protein
VTSERLCLSFFPRHRFQLKWYQKLFRLTKKEVLNTSVGRRVSTFMTRRRVGIRRADSKNFGRQISWSWKNTMLEKGANLAGGRTLASRHDSRSFSRGLSRGLSGEVVQGISRGISRGLSRGLSRGISTDDLFDPSSYTLPSILEEQQQQEKERAERAKKAVPKNIPSKQQAGERPGVSVSVWEAKVFTSRDGIEYKDPAEEEEEEEEGKKIGRGNSFADWFFRRTISKQIAPELDELDEEHET